MFFELQLPRPWADGDEQRLFQNALEWAEIGDRIGIACAWAQEHHFLEEYSHSTAPEVFLAALSQRTKHMRIGHGVTLMAPGYNHPARIAERIATLDLVSNGRVEWGTGESSSRIELEGFKLNYLEKRAMWLESVRETAKIISSEPYLGYEGKYFSMPARNVVPKPVQRPHPPMWVACTNRETMKFAARLGLGALTFAFMDATEAKYWVEEYYEIFKSECKPIGRRVNPNIAMLAGVMCHRDRDIAKERGIEGQQFFKWALAHYYRQGVHVPGRTNLWEEFKKITPEPMAGLDGVGTPEDVRDHFRSLEGAGVDQVIMLQQAGLYKHEHICESLELLGSDVLPEFIARDIEAQKRKQLELEPYIAKALANVEPMQDTEPQPVESYGTLWEKHGIPQEQSHAKRAVDSNMLWRVQVGQVRKSGS
ncbi:LLM class flavin-dependent oxidoreductase [Noviherbaspirillum sp.]|uniref:LLM class flavin-dependent oxidoreductase n=1 Tax=Noviherbaspirillum sp. TaxID=1926288 RepID=UPI002600C625|nr:LLM class flavin-dependent oxidoreductase [Noviherbaspirillum sp.]